MLTIWYGYLAHALQTVVTIAMTTMTTPLPGGGGRLCTTIVELCSLHDQDSDYDIMKNAYGAYFY